ncbi:unnamed protein product [Urochloa decumbens]|uniref:F-box domain-containing protein n=1 Tax=Urochloa decumbens TaxID=240449 RepID=A0ABC8VFP0_9POAL
MEVKRKTEEFTLAAASTAAISLVIGDCDLLREIFIRLGFPTHLVRAAAVCRRWLRAASDPAFLRRFRDIHPPCLLGIYISTFSISHSRFGADFVPILPQPPEVSALVRRGRFGLDSYASRSTCVMDCRNSRVVVNLFRDGDFTYGVHSPLHPSRGLVTFPRLPTIVTGFTVCTAYRVRRPNRGTGSLRFTTWFDSGYVLSKECDNGLAYFWFELDYCDNKEIATAHVYKLQDDAWSLQVSATTKISKLLASALNVLTVFLVDDKIYVGITVHNILVLDLTSSTFSTIKYPIKHLISMNMLVFDGEIMLSRANGSGLCLVHLNKFQLHVWLLTGCDGHMGDWLLINTICLRDLCANLKISNSTTEDEHDRDIYIHEVGDNAEFVFFQMHGYVLYFDVRSSSLQKTLAM